MSEPLTKWWADITKSCNPRHVRLPLIERQQVYLAADVDALLDDPQALAAYLIERKKEAQP